MVQTLSFNVIPSNIHGVSGMGKKTHSGFTSAVVLVNEQDFLLICHEPLYDAYNPSLTLPLPQ
jgi:hypothetical protein